MAFVHGAGGSPLTWHLQLAYFHDSGAVELPGHPTGAGLTSIPEYVVAVEKYLQAQGVERPVLVGHSMGGAIAIELALRNAQLAGLVLVGTGARLRVHPTIMAKIKEDYVAACNLIADWTVSPSCDPVIKEQVARELLKIRPEVTYGDFIACHDFDRMNNVDRISSKTLIICGADDKLTPVRYSEYLHQKIRRSKLMVIPNAGHMVMFEQHRAFNEAIEHFLAELDAH